MTIGTRTPGGWASGTTSLSVSVPASIASGDLMVMFVGAKPYNATIATPSGWTRVGTQQTNGTTGVSGAGTGSVTWTVFYKVAGSSESSVTVSVTSGNVALGNIWGFTKTQAAWVTPTAYHGTDSSSGTSYSITAASSSGNLKALDYLIHAFVTQVSIGNTNTHAMSATGLTIGTVTESPADTGTGTGADLAAGSSVAQATAGTSTADLVASCTLSAATVGAGSVIRVREAPSVHYVIYTSEKGAPSAAQILAGQDVNSNAAVASGQETAPTTTGVFTFAADASGLSAGTSYKISFVYTDGVNNTNVSTSSAWQTVNQGSFAVQEGAVDTPAFTGGVRVSGSFTVQEGTVDSPAFTGLVKVTGSFAAQEPGGDSASFSASSASTGSFAVQEPNPDTASFAGLVKVIGSFTVQEPAGDSAFFSSLGGVVGTLVAVEPGGDTASFSGKGQIIEVEVGVDNTWTPESATDSLWIKDSYLPKTWVRGVR